MSRAGEGPGAHSLQESQVFLPAGLGARGQRGQDQSSCPSQVGVCPGQTGSPGQPMRCPDAIASKGEGLGSLGALLAAHPAAQLGCCLRVPCGLAGLRGLEGKSDHLAPATAQGKQDPDCLPGLLRAPTSSANTWMAQAGLKGLSKWRPVLAQGLPV